MTLFKRYGKKELLYHLMTQMFGEKTSARRGLEGHIMGIGDPNMVGKLTISSQNPKGVETNLQTCAHFNGRTVLVNKQSVYLVW
jgi:hypothetical protein